MGKDIDVLLMILLWSSLLNLLFLFNIPFTKFFSPLIEIPIEYSTSLSIIFFCRLSNSFPETITKKSKSSLCFEYNEEPNMDMLSIFSFGKLFLRYSLTTLLKSKKRINLFFNTLFGLFESKEDALRGKEELLKTYEQVYVVNSSEKGVEVDG